ncbi:MAG: HAD family hydrolase [bacterium]|nr:HAD family hydrolase [bacterium]
MSDKQDAFEYAAFSCYEHYAHLTTEAEMAQERLFTRDPGQIRLLVVDLMFTLLLAKAHERRSMVCDVYRQIGKLSDTVQDQDIWLAIQRRRNALEPLKDDDNYWRLVNQQVLEELLVGRALQYANTRGRDIHDCILTDPSHYTVCHWLMQVLAQASKNGMRVVIGSNQRVASANHLLNHFFTDSHFSAVYTSEMLGVRKPHAMFWENILQREGIPAHEARHIGNSVRSDMGSVNAGVRAILLDPTHEHRYHSTDPKNSDSPADYRRLAQLLKAGSVRAATNATELRQLLGLNSH